MLACFQIKRTFCKLKVSLWVDCEAGQAEASITYDRIVMRSGAVEYRAVDSPAKAQAWLAETISDRGSRIEQWEREYRIASKVAA